MLLPKPLPLGALLPETLLLPLWLELLPMELELLPIELEELELELPGLEPLFFGLLLLVELPGLVLELLEE